MGGNGKDASIHFADGALLGSGIFFLYDTVYVACTIAHDTSVTGRVAKVNSEQSECLLLQQHFFQCVTLNKRHVAIKSFIMNAAVVVGVGNIYASEALYLSGIHPKRQAARVSRVRMNLLADNIKAVLAHAITAGGTTLRDFHGSDGEPGYFKQDLEVYGRAGEPCKHCLTPITAVVIGQRSSFYCKTCQT